MIREVNYNGTIIKYDLQRKRVKNINLRIKPDGSVFVSANSRVGVKYLDEFVLRKADFILEALDKFENSAEKPKIPLYTAEEFVRFIVDTYNETYRKFHEKYGVTLPTLKMRKMKSRWGSCNYVDLKITLNINLIYCTKEQIEYVIIHEFSHLLVHNHSKEFYKVVEQFCPDYNRIRKEMNKIIL